MIPGHGVSAVVGGRKILAGSLRFMESCGAWDTSGLPEGILDTLREDAADIVLAMTGLLSPVAGAFVHNGGSVLVIINSAFLLKWRQR